MSLRARMTFVLFSAFVLASPDHLDAATWTEIKSPHFTVVSDAGEARARAVAWHFEQMRAVVVKILPWAVTDFPLPVTIYAARDENSMRTLLPGEFEGRNAIRPASYFISMPAAHLIVVRSDINVESQGDMNPFITGTWSYFMLVMRSTFTRNLPVWFARGFSSVLSNTVVRRDAVHVGNLIPWHLQNLRGRARPLLNDILAVDDGSPYLKSNDGMEIFDAATWSLVHYLILGNQGKNVPLFNQLSEALRRGADAKEALLNTYGGAAALQSALAAYIDRSLYAYQRYAVDVNVNQNGFASRQLAAPDAAVRLAHLYAATRRPVEARAQIAAAGGTPAAAEVEGLLLDADGKRAAAQAAYARASEAGAANFYTEYRLAVLSWPNQDAPDEQARFATIEKGLRRAVAANPRFASTHSMLAEVLVNLDRASDALPLAQQSVTLASTDAYSYLALARAYGALSRREDAAASAKRALGFAASDRERDEARRVFEFFSKPVPAPAAAQASTAVQASTAAQTSTAAATAAQDEKDMDECEAGVAAACGRVFPIFEQGCARGRPRSCSFAAYLLAEGRGVPKDVGKAIGLLEAPCAGGTLEACTQLATLLASRQTTPDLVRARELLDKSCKGSFTPACDLLKSFR